MSDPTDPWEELARVQFADQALEAAVEDRILRPFVRALGWPDDCVHAKVPAYQRIGRRVQPGRKPEADIVLGDPTAGHTPPTRGYVVFEAKRPNEELADAGGQAESYSVSLRALLFVTCNGRGFEVWRTGWAQDEARLIVQGRIDEIVTKRAELERYLSPRAVREYHERERLPSARGDFNLADYVEHVSARTAALLTVPRIATSNGLGVLGGRVEVNSSSLPSVVAPGTCTFLDAGTGRGKTVALNMMAAAALRQQTPTFLPILISAENVTGSLLEAVLAELRPHLPGLESVAGVERLLGQVPALLLVDDWHRAATAQRRVLDGLPIFAKPPCAAVVSGARGRGRPSLATVHLTLERYTAQERDAVVARRTNRTTGARLEASLAPELQSLAREPLFLALLIDALRDSTRGAVAPPPNLTSLMERQLESVVAREHTLPAVEMITCVGAHVARARQFSLADVQKAIGECGGEQGAAAFATMMTMIGLWARVSNIGDHAFLDRAWRAYFQTCAAFTAGADWLAWLRDVAIDDLELAIPYAAHLAAVAGREAEFFRALLQRDTRLYMRSLGARSDVVRAGADDVQQGVGVLRSLRAGYLDIVELFAPTLRLHLEPWARAADVDEASRRVCVDGCVENGHLQFAFGFTADQAADTVSLEPVLAMRQRPRRAASGGYTLRGINLALSNIRVDSGRLIATRVALEQIRKTIAASDGGPLVAWLTRERLGELVRALLFSGCLDEGIESWTIDELAEWMDHPQRKHLSGWYVGRDLVERDELARVMASLRSDGLAKTPLFDMSIRRPRDFADAPRALRQLFDAVTLTYRAACEAWFPRARQHFFYGSGPFRVVAYLERDGVTYWHEPVTEWGVPCDVKTLAAGEAPPPWDAIVREIEVRASALDREPMRSVTSSSRVMTDWNSPVTREVRALLAEDLGDVDSWVASAT